ncbi:MAG: lytic transglycosylase domain-containing protein [Sphingomonadales bacterium]|nr:MAG: lytic transglycosylase domain-containing protein [Sphingomonadales bacterium]
MEYVRTILVRPRGLAFVAATLSLAAPMPAQADVLEIGGEGAHWVAGGPVVEPALQPGTVPDAPSQDIMIEDVPTPVGARILAPVSYEEAEASGVPRQYAAKVAELSARYDLSPALIEALIWQESRWRPVAISPKGARGLAQLMPGTARDLGVDPDDPFANLEGGARYLREQLDRFDGNLEKALAAYNAGPGRVERAGGIPRIRETQNYVVSIMDRLNDQNTKEEE